MYLEQNDDIIYDLLQKELKRQNEGLEMIASENFTFPAVMEVVGSVFTNKYAEGYPHKRYYGGCENVDAVEEIAINRAKELFKCEYANVQPHSGSQANAAVYAALLKPYDKLLGMSLSHGGHLTHGSHASFTGQNYKSFHYGVELDGLINYDEVEKIAHIVKPKIIVCGFSAYSRELDFERFKKIAESVGAYLMGDVAHVAGLIVAGEYPDPFPHCDIVTTTTHKTLRGPRGGMILSNSEEIAKKIDKAVFPGTQGGPLMNTIAAKAVAFKENLKPEWKVYARQVKTNAKKLAEVLINRGYDIVSNGTDNHLILISLLNKNFSGKDAEEALGKAGITVNKNTVPGETRSPFVTSGIRIGSAALTSRGMQEGEFEQIAHFIAGTLDNLNNEMKLKEIREKVRELALRFKAYDKASY